MAQWPPFRTLVILFYISNTLRKLMITA